MVKRPMIDYRFKFLYALGIIVVVAGHCGNGGLSIGYEFLPPYAYHLQLFMFCAGYFYKPEVENNPLKYIIKKIKHLLIPLFLYNILYSLITLFLSHYSFNFGHPVTIYNLFIEPFIVGWQFAFNGPGWFVIPLFFIQIMFMFINKFYGKYYGGIISHLLCFILCFISIWLALHEYISENLLQLCRVFYFSFFYALGVIYKSYLEKYDKMCNVYYFTIIIISLLIILLKYNSMLTYEISFFKGFNNGMFMPIVVPVLGIAFWLRISKIILPIVKNSNVIKLIADNTFTIMINHIFIFFIINTIIAILSKNFVLCPDFNWYEYKHHISYLYLYNGIEQFKFIYLFLGIIIPAYFSYWLKNNIFMNIDKLKKYS